MEMSENILKITTQIPDNEGWSLSEAFKIFTLKNAKIAGTKRRKINSQGTKTTVRNPMLECKQNSE